MAKFFDYDEHLGVRYDTEDGEDGEIIMHASQDVQPHIDFATKIRNSGIADKGIKNELWKYCTIPTHVEMAMREKGINIHNKDHTKAMLKEINTNYPHLKYTRLHHGG